MRDNCLASRRGARRPALRIVSLRHSLGTVFGSQEVPVQVIQKMFRQKKLEMTFHSMQGVNKQHMDVQGCFLMRLGLP